jgi:hypothetical protein
LYITNNLTGHMGRSSRTTLSLTYRHQNHVVAEGDPHNTPLPVGASIGGTVTINEDAGVFTAAVRPTANLDLNGSVEMAYADNALTPSVAAAVVALPGACAIQTEAMGDDLGRLQRPGAA